jgi:hypothetical protein
MIRENLIYVIKGCNRHLEANLRLLSSLMCCLLAPWPCEKQTSYHTIELSVK